MCLVALAMAGLDFKFTESATSAAAASEIGATAGTMNGDQIKELIAGLMAPITEMMKTMQGAKSSTEKDPSEEAAN